MSRLHVQDTVAVLRGLQLVLRASFAHSEADARHLWANSSLRTLLEQSCTSAQQSASQLTQNPQHELQQCLAGLRETLERGGVAAEGARQFALSAAGRHNMRAIETTDKSVERPTITHITPAKPPTTSIGGVDISAITLKELQSILAQNPAANPIETITVHVEHTKHTANASIVTDEKYVETWMDFIAQQNDPKTVQNTVEQPSETVVTQLLPPLESSVDAIPIVPELSSLAKQRSVPSSRIARLSSFGTLFAGLGVGTAGELVRGALGLGGTTNMREAVFSPANTERIVNTLCRVRGAALKIGQILSIQDESVVSPALVRAFERVRQAADYMPDWQVERCMRTEFGDDWRTAGVLRAFDERPFAAASIGQVHRAEMAADGMVVAVKIQYPGVARSIESDIDNLVGMLKLWDVFPAGFFIDNIVKVAKRELRWEVDYLREADYTEQYAQMIAPYGEYRVPKVRRELTTGTVLTSEFVPGVPVDKCFELPYEERHFIATSMLKLCLRELFELRCMQTDPNWSNFLYDRKRRQLVLIDFGATRFYTGEFIDNYRSVIRAALRQNGEEVLRLSRIMGFLTGYETRQMEQAHVQAVLTLAEPFRYEGEFDFGKQVSCWLFKMEKMCTK